MIIAVCLVVCVGAIGLATTEAGQSIIRWMFTPVEKVHTVEWQGPTTTTTENGKTVTRESMCIVSSNRSAPFSEKEVKKIRAKMQEWARDRRGAAAGDWPDSSRARIGRGNTP